MKRTFIFLFSFILILQANAQNKDWPYLNYAYAKVYMYNFNSDLNAKYQIIKNGKLDETALPSNKMLSKKQIDKLIDLTNKKVDGLISGLSKCFNPHHAIVFFDKSDKPLASIMFSFDCEAIRLQPEKKTKKRKKELSEKEINKLMNILSDYRSVIDELKCPVFNTVAEYQY